MNQLYQELIHQKSANNCQAGREIAQRFAISKINIQMKLLPADYFKFSLIMILNLDFRKFISLTAFPTPTQCLMII